MICFIYSGEVNIPNESIDKFLEAANELKIDGLIQKEAIWRENIFSGEQEYGMEDIPGIGKLDMATLDNKEWIFQSDLEKLPSKKPLEFLTEYKIDEETSKPGAKNMPNSSYKMENDEKEGFDAINLVKGIKFEEVVEDMSGDLYGFRQVEKNHSQLECENCPSTFVCVSEMEEHVWEHHSINNETLNGLQPHTTVEYTNETKEFAISHRLKEKKNAEKK